MGRLVSISHRLLRSDRDAGFDLFLHPGWGRQNRELLIGKALFVHRIEKDWKEQKNTLARRVRNCTSRGKYFYLWLFFCIFV